MRMRRWKDEEDDSSGETPPGWLASLEDLGGGISLWLGG